MKKYYNDPLAAAYMAMEFGVKYVDDNPKAGTETWLGKFLYADKYHIHPDSYHIFEPQVGDVIIDALGQTLKQGNMSKTDCFMLVKDGVCRIIQRNDKPFFWPESEETDE